MEQGSTTRDADGIGLFAREVWFDPIEAGIRERMRGFIQELMVVLGRSRSERATGELKGYRNGIRDRQLRPGRAYGATRPHGSGQRRHKSRIE